MLRRLEATRVLHRVQHGSSSPTVVATQDGEFLVKLRGGAEGAFPLIAEIIVSELAERLTLAVAERALVELPGGVPSDDRNDELADLLDRSVGLNLGLRYLREAREIRSDQLGLVPDRIAARVLWLDWFVVNPDRTARNPNLLFYQRKVLLIDHGAALSFQHDWANVTEAAPLASGTRFEKHVLSRPGLDLEAADRECTELCSREALEAAAEKVPDEFLTTAFPEEPPGRMRAAYAAFLWKRLKAPRRFEALLGT